MIGNAYGPGSGTIWLEKVSCNDMNNALEDCNHDGWGITDNKCDHGDDVSITCSNNLTNTIGKLQGAQLSERNRATL